MIKNKWTRGCLLGLAVFGLTLGIWQTGVFEILEWKSWDVRMRMLSDPADADKDIVLILIDQSSLDLYSQEQGISWPWPRQMYIPIITFCRDGGARAVFFDLIFSEDSVWGVEDDLALAGSMQEKGGVFLPVHFSRREGVPAGMEIPTRFKLSLDFDPASAAMPASSVTAPLPIYMAAVQGLGNVQTPPDKDGIFRRIPLLVSWEDAYYPALPLTMNQYLTSELRMKEQPLDKDGRMIIRFHGPAGVYTRYSAAAVINSYARKQAGETPQIPPGAFEDKIVLVGGSAPGILDLRPTPFSPVFPGVEIQAAVLDNLLNGDAVKPASFFVTALFLFCLSFGISLGATIFTRLWALTGVVLAGLLIPAAAAAAAFSSGTWLEFTAPLFAAVFAFVLAVFMNYRVEGRQKRFIRQVFNHYLSGHVIERIIAEPDRLKLGGEQREVSSFFSDVAGFTSISEGLSPEELVQMLNRYLSEMSDIILKSGGTLDKYEGDAIIAFWNAPLDQSNHAFLACRSALECQKRLQELRPEFAETYGHETHARIGINSGPAVVGNMGSESRFDYTAMGDTINLASRLEGACKAYGISTLIGEQTQGQVSDKILTREVDLIKVVGKTRPVRVYELIGMRDEVSKKRQREIEQFEEALGLYREREWLRAADGFQILPHDPVAVIYLQRVQQLAKSPPPDSWNGVFELKSK
jgi:adenylate cyclase